MNDIVPVDGLKQECVLLAKVQGVQEGASNVKFLKTLCLRGWIFQHALSVDGKRVKQRLEECHSSAQAMWRDYEGHQVKMDHALLLLEKVGIRHVEREDIFVSMKVVKRSLVDAKGRVLGVREMLPGTSTRSKQNAGSMCHWESETVPKMFAVRTVIIPDSAAQVIRWYVQRTEEDSGWRAGWRDEKKDLLGLAEMIEFLAKRKNKGGKTMDELVEQDLQKLRSMIKKGELEGDGWKVQPNDYDWLLGRRGRRDVE